MLERISGSLLDPGALYASDSGLFHGVTAVTPRDPSRLAHRDVLVLTYGRGT